MAPAHGETSPLIRADLTKAKGGALPAACLPEPPPSARAGRAAWAVLIGLLHITCSAGLILFNKYVMSPQRFPYAICLTTMHMFTALVFAGLLRMVVPGLFPSADRVLGGSSALRAFLPVGVCCAVSVVGANSAYNFASVSFLQMVKESMVLWVYLLGVLAGLEPLRFKYLGVLVFVACSAMVAVCSEVSFRWPGLLLQLTSSLSQASQAVLMNRMMTSFQGVKVDPMTLILGSAPVVLCLLLPITCALWDDAFTARLAEWWHVLLVNALAAFVLQVVNAITIRELSATGLALAAMLKDLAIVGAAAGVLHESLTRLQMLGFGGAVCGIAVYSAMKLRAGPAKPPLPADKSLHADAESAREAA